jgi:hypothetical protein
MKKRSSGGSVSAWWGVGGLALATAAGAAIGATVNTPCPTSGTGSPNLLCGPSGGALIGGADGLLLGGVLGLGAALSPKYRAAGITAAGVTLGIMLLSRIKSASATPQVTQ